ncbi:MAG: polysaccharide biosynthesis C-terminal domain-containing protein [Lentisphaeria bacterium]
MKAANIFAKGVFVTLVISTAMGICNYLTRRYLACTLEPAQFGILYSAINLFLLVAALADFGMNNAIMLRMAQLLAQKKKNNAWNLFLKIFLLKSISSIIICGIFILLSRYLCLYYYKYPAGIQVYKIICFYCISYQLLLFLMAVLNGLKYFIWMNLLNFSFYFTAMVGIFLVRGHNFFSISCFYIGGGFIGIFIICALILFRYRKFLGRDVKKCHTESILELLKLSKWFALGNIAITAMNSIDILLLTHTMGVETAGIYNIAMSISLIIAPITLAANLIMPIIVSLWETKQMKEISSLFNIVLIFFSFMFWGGVIFFVSFSREIIVLLFTKRYVAAYGALCILGPGALLNALVFFFYGILNGIGRVKKANLLLMLGIPVDIIINLSLVPFVGMIGAAIGTVSGFILVNILMFCAIKRVFPDIKIPKFYTTIGLSIAVVCGILSSSTLYIRTIYFFIAAIVLFMLFCFTYFKKAIQ